MQIHNLFPLTVVEDKIEIAESERVELIEEINYMHQDTKDKLDPRYAWTGDTHGYEFLFNNPKFEYLASQISSKIFNYLNALSINPKKLSLYYHSSNIDSLSIAFSLSADAARINIFNDYIGLFIFSF